MKPSRPRKGVTLTTRWCAYHIRSQLDSGATGEQCLHRVSLHNYLSSPPHNICPKPTHEEIYHIMDPKTAGDAARRYVICILVQLHKNGYLNLLSNSPVFSGQSRNPIATHLAKSLMGDQDGCLIHLNNATPINYNDPYFFFFFHINNMHALSTALIIFYTF